MSDKTMKLFTRYNRINLLATVGIFLLSGISFYFLLRYVIVGQVDEDLKIEQHEIETYVAKYNQLPEIIAVRDQHVGYAAAPLLGKRIFHTIQSMDNGDKEKEPFRELIFFIRIKDNWYKISVSKSLEGTDKMVQSIVTITLVTILMILVASLLINRLVLKKLWQPFYDSLAAMRYFEVGKNRPLSFPATEIEEFSIMNDTLQQTTSKADEDYKHLKEFTENAAHEIQTPLAIIQSKMDVLIQDEKLSELQSRAVQGAYEAIQRLTRLNHALLLLTKIENGQFGEIAHINVAQKIKDKIGQFEELIGNKQLTVTTTLDETAQIKMNPVLADIVLNNLFSNAIKYNKHGGTIDIIVDPGIIEISNSAHTPELDRERLFRRFATAGKVKDGIGLGLAIVRQVAEVSGMEAQYTYEHEQHHFILADRHH